MTSGMRDLSHFDESSSEGPKSEESGVFEEFEKIGRDGDEKGGVGMSRIESDRGRGAAFGESQKVEKGSRRIWPNHRKTEEVEGKKEDHAEVFLKNSRIETKRSKEFPGE
jgi:hypothetical protein